MKKTDLERENMKQNRVHFIPGKWNPGCWSNKCLCLEMTIKPSFISKIEILYNVMQSMLFNMIKSRKMQGENWTVGGATVISA